MSRRRRSDYRLSLGWILGVTFIGTLTRLKLPQWSSLSFGAAVCLRLPPHTTSQRKLSRLATDHATCSCLRLTVATNSPRKGLSPPIQCPCRAHQFFAELVDLLNLDPSWTDRQYERDSWEDLRAVLEKTFRRRDRDEWTELFAGSDACVTPVLTPDEAAQHPHNCHRDSFRNISGSPMPIVAPKFGTKDG